MRITRTLFASAAITAALAISAPTANAMTVAELSASEDGGYGNDEHEHDKSKHSESDEDKEKKDSWSKDKPKGGVHAGGGGLAQSGNSMAAGSVLLLGGLGAGVYMLRRRNASDVGAV